MEYNCNQVDGTGGFLVNNPTDPGLLATVILNKISLWNSPRWALLALLPDKPTSTDEQKVLVALFEGSTCYSTDGDRLPALPFPNNFLFGQRPITDPLPPPVILDNGFVGVSIWDIIQNHLSLDERNGNTTISEAANHSNSEYAPTIKSPTVLTLWSDVYCNSNTKNHRPPTRVIYLSIGCLQDESRSAEWNTYPVSMGPA